MFGQPVEGEWAGYVQPTCCFFGKRSGAHVASRGPGCTTGILAELLDRIFPKLQTMCGQIKSAHRGKPMVDHVLKETMCLFGCLLQVLRVATLSQPSGQRPCGNRGSCHTKPIRNICICREMESCLGGGFFKKSSDGSRSVSRTRKGRMRQRGSGPSSSSPSLSSLLQPRGSRCSSRH